MKTNDEDQQARDWRLNTDLMGVWSLEALAIKTYAIGITHFDLELYICECVCVCVCSYDFSYSFFFLFSI